MNRLLVAVCLLVGASTLAWAQDPRLAPGLERFAAAQTLERESPSERGKIEAAYRSAAEAFRKVAESDGVHSARLFTNVGNAYFFAGDLGEANLWFGRALVLDPDHDDALAGRRLVRKQLPWREPTSVSEDLLGTLFFWHQGSNFGTRQGLFLIVWPLGFLLLAVGRKRRLALWLGSGAVGVGAVLLVSLGLSARAEAQAPDAVIRVRVEGRSGDSKSYSLSHSSPLPAGSEAKVLEDREAWVHVELRDGSRGWIPSEALARVIPQ